MYPKSNLLQSISLVGQGYSLINIPYVYLDSKSYSVNIVSAFGICLYFVFTCSFTRDEIGFLEQLKNSFIFSFASGYRILKAG